MYGVGRNPVSAVTSLFAATPARHERLLMPEKSRVRQGVARALARAAAYRLLAPYMSPNSGSW